MDLDFLPKLPKSNLDDRTYQDLKDESLLRIPRYCPEWTNYNASDPGITMIELFAWMTEQMLQRFNQVPRRNYVTFLELLGIRLQAPAPAQTNLTFYLNSTLAEPYTIPTGIEVATLRTEGEEAVVFSTDRDLTIGSPGLRHFLTAEIVEDTPQTLRDRFTDLWTQDHDGRWSGPEQALFAERPETGNCFYLVLEPASVVDGNVLAVNVQGEAATSTGINPNLPPRRWEAWDGETWQPVLRDEIDDSTQGFSFSELSQQGLNAVQGADVVLHLPMQFPVTNFLSYQGRWLRCVCTPPNADQPAYSRSPQIMGLSVRTIGGSVAASQCTLMRDEVLGLSEGTPGQSFQLFGVPVLPRRQGEYIQVIPPGGLPQNWQEVPDFSQSQPDDHHYVIDSLTGVVQFGPLVREPHQLKQETEVRSQIQTSPRQQSTVNRVLSAPMLERQYGAVPPRGAMVRMVAYRTGGGQRGNVQPGSLTVMKTAVPYVASVINHDPAQNGTDAESLEQAAIRVPGLLRSRDRAVTPEDFETLTLQGAQGGVAQCRCLPATKSHEAGIVRLLVVPKVNLEPIYRAEGIHPDQFSLSPTLQQRILSFLADRKLLGVEVKLEQPEYVGVSVRAEVGLSPEYNNPQSRDEILRTLRVLLYRFLNPLTGGLDGNGWQFGRPVYQSDIVALFQQVPGVRYLGVVQLFELRKQNGSWIRNPSPDPVIDPGSFGLICSWSERRIRAHHTINLIS
ncbi:putative baseplate assembly protein [Pantanalinema rosaneae CENA516]|uniref:putative baseplate assembly protein n=1 Tax=Pantanalinema rosaneae TaxID=1620701 RepID=UPI003D6F2110